MPVPSKCYLSPTPCQYCFRNGRICEVPENSRAGACSECYQKKRPCSLVVPPSSAPTGPRSKRARAPSNPSVPNQSNKRYFNGPFPQNPINSNKWTPIGFSPAQLVKESVLPNHPSIHPEESEDIISLDFHPPPSPSEAPLPFEEIITMPPSSTNSPLMKKARVSPSQKENPPAPEYQAQPPPDQTIVLDVEEEEENEDREPTPPHLFSFKRVRQLNPHPATFDIQTGAGPPPSDESFLVPKSLMIQHSKFIYTIMTDHFKAHPATSQEDYESRVSALKKMIDCCNHLSMAVGMGHVASSSNL